MTIEVGGMPLNEVRDFAEMATIIAMHPASPRSGRSMWTTTASS